MGKVVHGGGWQAVFYVFKIARIYGILKLWRAMTSRNACKTCAVGMGGQNGGMTDERKSWPEVCKKSFQAMAADMQDGITNVFFNQHSISQLKELSPKDLESLGRLTTPLYYKTNASHFQPVSWDFALNHIANNLKNTKPERSFFYFSGRSSNEAGFLLQLFARVFGTNNINNCSYYCHQASGVGLSRSIGSGTATVELDDLEHCDLFFLIGANPSSNHPRLMTILKDLKRRGGKVIVINPIKEAGLVRFKVPSDPWSLFFGSKIATNYVQLRSGSDVSLLSGIGKYLIEKGLINLDFVTAHTNDWLSYKTHLASLSWQEIVESCGISKNEIEELALIYSRAKNVVFGWCMGITHHLNGVENVQAIANLALMRGMIGKRGAGLLPIRGHSNVQGMGTMGVTPKLKKEIFDRLSNLDIQIPSGEGFDTMSSMEAAHAGKIDFAFCLGGNLYGSNPDSNFAETAFNKIKTVIYLSTTLNTGHIHGVGCDTLILPVLARDEESQATTQESMFSFVRVSDGGRSRHAGPISETEIISEIADRVLGSSGILNWREMKKHRSIRKLIAKIIPNFESFETIDDTKKEFQIRNRILHSPEFNTLSKKAKFHLCPLPKLIKSNDEFNLISLRSEGQFNTVVYEDYDLYRGSEHRKIVFLNAKDMKRLGISENQLVTVKSKIGEMKSINAKSFDICEGSAAMYYPEVNQIIERSVDPLSKTPSFKSTKVTFKR